MSQNKFGDILGLSTVQVSNIEQGIRDIKLDLANKMVIAFNANPDWLITGKGEMFLNGGASEDMGVSASLLQVKLIDAKASAGPGHIVYEEGHSYISIPSELIRPYNPQAIELIRVDGHSMEPAMYPGDLLAVVRSPENWVSERYFILRMYGELRVKRLIRRANGLIAVISNNPEYGTEEITEEEFKENVDVIARVVKVIHAEDV